MRNGIRRANAERYVVLTKSGRNALCPKVPHHLVTGYDTIAVLPDALATYLEWRRLVVAYAVAGAAVHDARLVASMKVYGVPHLVTVNVEDFRRCHDISVIAPQALVSHAP